MVQIGKDKFDFVRHMYHNELEGRRNTPSIADCMTRIYSLLGLTNDKVLVAGDALKEDKNRQLFMTINDDLTVMWVERQIAKENQLFRQFF